MAGEKDPPWENEFSDDDPTKLGDGPTLPDEAIPDLAPSKDSTGKHKTLPGFADAIEQTRQHYLALGKIDGIEFVLMGFKLIRIGAGDHPMRAVALTEKFRKWLAENEVLIREALKKD